MQPPSPAVAGVKRGRPAVSDVTPPPPPVDGLGSLLSDLEGQLTGPSLALHRADDEGGGRYRPPKAAPFCDPAPHLATTAGRTTAAALTGAAATAAIPAHTSAAAATTAKVREAIRAVAASEGAPVTLLRPPAAAAVHKHGPSAAAGSGRPGRTGAATGASASTAAASAALFADSINLEEVHKARESAFASQVAKAQRLEEMDAAMMQVTTRVVSRWHCRACDRWYDKAPSACFSERHHVDETKATQHALQCGHCSQRRFAFIVPCFTPCANCGRVEWQATSVFHLRGGGMLTDVTLDPSQRLLPTGDAVENSLRFGGELHAGEG